MKVSQVTSFSKSLAGGLTGSWPVEGGGRVATYFGRGASPVLPLHQLTGQSARPHLQVCPNPVGKAGCPVIRLNSPAHRPAEVETLPAEWVSRCAWGRQTSRRYLPRGMSRHVGPPTLTCGFEQRRCYGLSRLDGCDLLGPPHKACPGNSRSCRPDKGSEVFNILRTILCRILGRRWNLIPVNPRNCSRCGGPRSGRHRVAGTCES